MGMAPPAVGDAGYRQISNLKAQKSYNFELGLINNAFEDNLGLTFETAFFSSSLNCSFIFSIFSLDCNFSNSCLNCFIFIPTVNWNSIKIHTKTNKAL